MLVPSGLSILPVGQIKLFESVQCISRILDLVSDFRDAFIDSVSLDGVLLMAQCALVDLVREVNDLGVELSHASRDILQLLSDLLTELLVVDLLVHHTLTITQKGHLKILLIKFQFMMRSKEIDFVESEREGLAYLYHFRFTLAVRGHSKLEGVAAGAPGNIW